VAGRDTGRAEALPVHRLDGTVHLWLSPDGTSSGKADGGGWRGFARSVQPAAA
jgi:hypothetical protein